MPEGPQDINDPNIINNDAATTDEATRAVSFSGLLNTFIDNLPVSSTTSQALRSDNTPLPTKSPKTLTQTVFGIFSPNKRENGDVPIGQVEVVGDPASGAFSVTTNPEYTNPTSAKPVIQAINRIRTPQRTKPTALVGGGAGSTEPDVPYVPYFSDEDPAGNALPLNEVQLTGGGGAGSTEPDVPYTSLEKSKDMRVRISLAPNANCLYKAQEAGILSPLKYTGGVVYPYMPSINVSYRANYASADLAHTNYRSYSYKNSDVSDVSITGKFTAQDTTEAEYVLAVIHFFRSVTKMFYGQDQNRGVPPPLVYLSGLGAYHFDNHPMVISNFTLNYPQDVDYINAKVTSAPGPKLNGFEQTTSKHAVSNRMNFSSSLRLSSGGLAPGGRIPSPKFGASTPTGNEITRIPTAIDITISCMPMISRYAVSNKFSLTDYATGKLLRGSSSFNSGNGGGMW